MAQSAQELPPAAGHVVEQAEREFGHTRVPLGGGLRILDFIGVAAHAAGSHHLPAFAGNLAYNSFVAIVPFVLFLVSVLDALGATDLLRSLLDVLSATLPAFSTHLLRDQVQGRGHQPDSGGVAAQRTARGWRPTITPGAAFATSRRHCFSLGFAMRSTCSAASWLTRCMAGLRGLFALLLYLY